MDKLLMRLFRLLKPLFRKSDPDFDKMMVILETKLTMDNRRVNMNWRSNSQKQNSGQLTRVLIIYTIFGFMMGAVILYAEQLLTVMIIFHSYVLFMMAMTLVTDFSSVLLDTTDNQIILGKPVSSKTIFLARSFHIMIYLLQFTAAISLGSWIFTFIKFGLFTGMTLIVTTFLTVLLAVFLTYFLYLAMLRFSSEQRIKEIITWFQIIMTVLFSFGYQILPRMLRFSDFRDTVQLNWYAYLLPPVWMASVVESVQKYLFDPVHFLMIFLAVAVPVTGFWVLNKYLAPGFSAKLMALQQGGAPVKQISRTEKKPAGLTEKIAGIVTRTVKEKSAFTLTWLITGRDRNFRMQFYPALGYILVLFFIFVLRGNRSLAENWNELPGSSKYLWFIYAPVFLTSTAFSLISFNENFQASWIFHSTPLSRPGEIIIGAMKSIIVKYFLPVYLILFAAGLWIWGGKIIFDFVFGFFNNLFCCALAIYFSDHYLPFSRQPATKQQAGRFAKSMLQLVIIVVLVGYHYFLLSRPWVLTAIIPLLIAGTWFIFKFINSLAWKKISV